jgi:hypothetical protein
MRRDTARLVREQGRVVRCSRACGMPGLEGGGRAAVLVYRSNAALILALRRDRRLWR